MSVNIGDVIATVIYLVILILMISLVVVVIRRFSSSNKQRQIINEKLDKILDKLENDKK